MSLSYCYIDYSKQNEVDLSIDKKENSNEIKIESKYADIYFYADVNDSIELIEDKSFVLLIDGSIESQDLTAKKLLEMLDKIGIKETLDKVDGVFSLTLYDKAKDLFYVSRDHFGLTNLYYYQKDDFVMFSNTLKAFKNSPLFEKKINFDTLGQYLQYSYIFQPNTMFVDCYKVRSAYFMKFDLSNREVNQEKYWDIVDYYNKPRVKMSEEDILKKSEKLLKSVIKEEVGKSKKVGAFLSGGYDSSAIASILSDDKSIDLQTFTVGFNDDELDEAPFAKKIAEHLNIKHNEYYFNADYLKTFLMRYAEVYDEPIADMAALPTMLICESASEKIDILFGGEGGDEIFASSSFMQRVNHISKIAYPVRLFISYLYKPFSMSTKYDKMSKMMGEKNVENIWKYKDITMSFGIVKKLIIAPVKVKEMEFKDTNLDPSSHLLDKLFPLMFKSYVSNNLLTKISYATNRYNISAKAPYLNKKFIEFLATVDVSVKHKNEKNKYILRKIIQKYIPLNLIDRPKRGFSTPAGEILKNEHRALLDNYINRDRLEKEGVFKPEEIMKLKDSFLNSRSVYDEQNIWNILIFELWYDHWFSE